MGTMKAYAEYAEDPALKPYSPKKTGFFKRKILNWLTDGSSLREEVYATNMVSPSIGARAAENSFHQQVEDGLSLTIHNANGGYVVSFRRYDRIKDRNNNSLYIIGSEQKFEDALAQCIAMECLQR